MSPFNNPHIDALLEHEVRNVIASGLKHSTTQRMLALKIADDIGNQDQMLTRDSFLIDGF
tara:strand:+ start:335 stop:514 length:180 start_codon:yes stop_codon:yes gene_type:complete